MMMEIDGTYPWFLSMPPLLLQKCWEQIWLFFEFGIMDSQFGEFPKQKMGCFLSGKLQVGSGMSYI